MWKKLFDLLIALTLLLVLIPSIAVAAPQGQEEAVYTVQKDDNLWVIAEKYLGNGAAYVAIVAATNAKHEADSSFAKIEDPSLIQPGWKVLVPGAEEAAKLVAEGLPVVVKKLPDLEGREVVVAVENAYPPFNFIDEATGEAVGWDFDAWRAICGLVNCTPVFKETAWEGIFEAAAAGEFDVAADGITIKPEREKVVAFSDPYMLYGQVVLVRADETEITDKDTLVTLTEKTVGVQLATTNEATAIELVGEDRVESYDTFDMAVVALMAGDVDAVVIDEPAALGYIAVNPGQLKIAGERFTSEALGFVFQQGSDLIEPANAALAALKADGTWDGLFTKWFIEFKPE